MKLQLMINVNDYKGAAAFRAKTPTVSLMSMLSCAGKAINALDMPGDESSCMNNDIRPVSDSKGFFADTHH